MNSTIASIKALRESKVEVDRMCERINCIANEKEKEINNNVDIMCKQIEHELEEIYELTDPDIYYTRHINIGKFDDVYFCICFDGKVNKMYALGNEKSGGIVGDDMEYHVLIAQNRDGSGYHYYEDGKWQDNWKEYIVSNWKEIKRIAEFRIKEAYECDQKNKLEAARKRLDELENRLDKTALEDAHA